MLSQLRNYLSDLFRAMRFPLLPYLYQPVFCRTYKTVYNPWRFWYLHQVRFLERCWLREYRPEQQPNP
ncbi:hypothetical protein C7293_18810 [filamentous cyanobacterium CCT1]|nr:hypothetical protein C7293_18810 [filamentous cyanobacterium CCT1]PSN79508.1 hypothetical protein C8B47_11345 [filamentous cyanobacterium CCP4]PSR16593.1 hypothetical protein C8255_17080 [filamentous cyanobacterium CCP3]